jgi:hypothetical protein
MKWRAAVAVFLFCVLLVSLTIAGTYGLSRPVVFDGAMNLQVAQSLAEGQGYVRNYGGVRPFPTEVQTNVPFVLPAAAVFAVSGVGLLQSQLTNFVYLVALLALIAGVGTRLGGVVFGLLTALAVMLTPGFFWIGMNGWGELPALFWWFAGTWLLLKDRRKPRSWLAPAGCICLGLAMATKTVLLIGLAASAAVYTLWVLQRGRDSWLGIIRKLLLAAVFVAVPLLAIEVWRFLSMGASGYHTWWSDQFHAIAFQTGVADTRHDAHQSKLARHFAALASQTRLSPWLLGAWILIPLIGSGVALARRPVASERNRLWLACLLVSVIYFIWWLMITPDSHVRLRRIEIGLVLNGCTWLFFLHWGFGKVRKPSARFYAMSLAAVLLATVCVSFAMSAVADARKRWGADLGEFHSIVQQVSTLPADAKLFGKGFLSSPILGLYADRTMEDIDYYTAGDLARLGSGYIVVDPVIAKDRRFAPELSRYPHQVAIDAAGIKVYRLDFTRKNNPFSVRVSRSGATDSLADFRKPNRYALAFGLLPPSKGGRWARTDAEVLLKYNGASSLSLSAYRPNQPYARSRPLTLDVFLDDCRVGTSVLAPGAHTLRYPVGTCKPAIGRNVRVRIEADNMLQPTMRDLRQHSYVLSTVGFTD